MKSKITGIVTRGVFLCASCFLLLAYEVQAQSDNEDLSYLSDMQNLPPYWFNFEYIPNRCAKTITFEALTIRLPYSYFKNAFPFTQNSNYDTRVSEEEKKDTVLLYKSYRFTIGITYHWDNGNIWQGLISSDASASIGALAVADKRRREVRFRELDSLLDHDDSLRYKIHSILRKKHEAYLLARTGIDFNVARFLEKVAEVRLIDTDGIEKQRVPENLRKIIYQNDTISTYGKLLITVKKDVQSELLSLLGEDSEWMSIYRILSYFPEYYLLLSDKDNNYLGSIWLGGCNANKVKLNMTESYTYSSLSSSYKNCDRINELIETVIKEKSKKKK